MSNDTWNYRIPTDPQEIPDEWVWERLRNKRNMLLSLSDWTQTLDATVDQETWAEYRKKLRNLPNTNPDPRKIVWPKEPS